MLSLFYNSLVLAGSFVTLVGLLVLVQIFLIRKREPMDASNRINHLRLVWFALKSPHKFTDLYFESTDEHGEAYIELAFPWLTEDEGENVDGAI